MREDTDQNKFYTELYKQTNRVLTKLYGGRWIDGQGLLAAEITGWLKKIYGPDVEISNFRIEINDEGQREYKCDCVVRQEPEEVIIEITKCLTGIADAFDQDDSSHVDGASDGCPEEMQ